MKAIQRMKGKVFFLFVLIVCLCVCDIPVQAASNYTKKVTKKNADFTLSAEYGLGGLVYYEMPTMINVTLKCKENFTGTLRIIPEDNTMSTVAYGMDISLSAGEAKTFQFVPSTITYNGRVLIEVLDEKGKVVFGERHEVLTQDGGEEVTVGILSDDYGALSYFDGNAVEIKGMTGVTSIFELTKDNFPEDSKALTMMQYMIIDNFDTATLSAEQYDALKGWVQDGGVLILSLGSSYQNVLHCFTDSFVTGTLGDLEKKDVTWDALYEVTKAAQTTADQTTVTQTEELNNDEDAGADDSLKLDCIAFQLDGGEPLADTIPEDLISSKKVGHGRVVVLAYSMGMEPMTSAENRKEIAGCIIDVVEVEATSNKFYGSDVDSNTMYSGLNVAELADTSSKPSVLLYGIILVVYVFLVGPVLYLILKKMNKRENIWVAIPIVALTFTAVIYATGFLYRINKPLISTFTVIQLQDDVKSEKIYTSTICPKPKQYTVQFADGYTGFRKDTGYYYGGMFSFANSTNTGSFDYMLKENSKGMEVLFNTTEPFQKTNFLLNKNSDNNIGTLDSDLTCYTDGFDGTVTNNTCYDLKDVVVTFENYLCLVGDIKKGETATIDKSKIIVMNGYGSFDKLYPETRMYVDREMGLRYQINTMVETQLINKNEFKTGYVWGCMQSYQPDVVDGSDVKRAGCGIIFDSYKAEYADVKGAYYSNIDGMVISSQGDYDIQDRSLYTAEAVLTYSFDDCSEITELENVTLKENNLNPNFRVADVYAYNVETGDYEQIFVNGTTLNGSQLKKYMLDNVIILKFTHGQSNGKYYNYCIPRISAKGEE